MAKQFYNINTDLIDRIKSVMREENVGVSAIAEELGYDKGSMSRTLNGKRPAPASLLEAISRVYKVNREWLQTGQGCMREEPNIINNDTRTGVPYYNVDFTLGFDLLENDQTRTPDYYVDFAPYNRCTCWINARGDSMSPTISSGDMVALQRIEDFRYLISGEIYAVVTKNGLRTIKRVSDMGTTLKLIPDNKEYDEQVIPKEELVAVFYVKGNVKAY